MKKNYIFNDKNPIENQIGHTIQTKFGVGQAVFFMSDNKVVCGVIEKILITIRPAIYGNNTSTEYVVTGSTFSQSKLFETKAELLASL